MKTNLVALFLICYVFSYPQTINYRTDKIENIRQISDSIASNTKRPYHFQSEGWVERLDLYRVRYVNNNDSTIKLSVFFSKIKIGENKALEIKGKTKYVFYTAIGKYLDIFPFWKKFIDKTADETACSTKYNSCKVNNMLFNFNEYQGSYWELKLDEN